MGHGRAHILPCSPMSPGGSDCRPCPVRPWPVFWEPLCITPILSTLHSLACILSFGFAPDFSHSVQSFYGLTGQFKYA